MQLHDFLSSTVRWFLESRDSWVGQTHSCSAILECCEAISGDLVLWKSPSEMWSDSRVGQMIRGWLLFFLSFLSLAFIMNLLNPIDSFLFMEEVVEHLVMATASPSCINGVYWSHLVCGFKGFALFGFTQRSCIVSRNTFAWILIQRAKEEEKNTGTLFFHCSWISFCAISFLLQICCARLPINWILS